MRTFVWRSVGRAALCLAATLGSAIATAQDDWLQVVLRPAGWSAEWAGPGGSGMTEVVFERRGDQVVARIRLVTPFELACENPVVIEGRSLTFDGCRDPAVTLVYDPADATHPLKGRSPRGYEWKARPK